MSDYLKIKKIRFCAGYPVGTAPTEITPSNIVLIVGPNNSGKSLALREIERWCIGQNEERKVIGEIDICYPDDEQTAIGLLDTFKAEPQEGRSEDPNEIWVGQHTFRQNQPVIHEVVSKKVLRNALNSQTYQHLRNLLLRFYTIRLDARTRFALADPKPTGDLQKHPQNHLWALFKDDASRDRVRELTKEAFDLYLVIDPTGMRNFRMRMSSKEPPSKEVEQGLSETSRKYHMEATELTEFSDGVQAFTGLISAIMSLPHRVILVDEPQAFLHPPLARRLGKDMAKISQERNASLIIATHSADYIIGCVTEAAQHTTIVRLTYEGDEATARALDSGDIVKLMQDPLLRSANALKGMFHKSVVVTEGDADRAFYDEINRRLQDIGKGIDDAMFINAQNWQTIPRIIKPLRKLGIPSACIMDLDVLSGNWHDIYDALNIEISERTRIETDKSQCQSILNTISNKDDIKKNGIAALPKTDKGRVNEFIRKIAEYGLFLVHVGELESWLKKLSVQGAKSNWLLNVFNKMGFDPSDNAYVKPEDDDVWQFIDDIGAWCHNPTRKGLK